MICTKGRIKLQNGNKSENNLVSRARTSIIEKVCLKMCIRDRRAAVCLPCAFSTMRAVSANVNAKLALTNLAIRLCA